VKRVYVIGNPRAGRGKVTSGWDEVRAAFASHGIDAETAETQAPSHAIELASNARRAGADLVVALGGDGTVHEVVNGLLSDSSTGELPALGVLPAGSGCDFSKTFDIPEDINGAIAHLADADLRRIDVGEVQFIDGNRLTRRFFVNIAEVGIGAEIVERAQRMPRALGGGVYFASFLITLPSFRRRKANIEMDGESYEGVLTNLVVANAKVFGGGMRVAPGADPADGVFDVQIQFGSKVDYARGISKVYKGTHIPHPRIRETLSSSLTVGCDPPALIEADGEVLGRTPATFSILPGALLLKA
jgi:diacylglycerol kinase (ATP)